MAYNPTAPADDQTLAAFPPEMREQLRAIINDQVVNALKVMGLSPGNASGNIAVSNGTRCINLNADKLDDKEASAFAPAGWVPPVATGSSNGSMSNTDKAKLDTIAQGAEVNQNAFSSVLVGSTTIQADSKMDTFELVAGQNIGIAPDATNDRATIAVTGKVTSAAAADTATTAGACTGNAATATNATNHITASSGAHAASAISVTTTGDISSTTVQTALAELDNEKQPKDATLTAITALPTAANQMIYSTGTDAFAMTALTAFARTLLDDVDAVTARNTLGSAPLASPNFTGTPTAPTADVAANNTQVATTAFVKAAMSAASNGIVAASLATNGYVKFANGVIIQWGITAGNGNGTVRTYPIAFPNACWSVASNKNSKGGYGAADGNSAGVQLIDNATFYAYADDGSNISVTYIAIGY